jgi:hypothetical protein
MHGQSLFPPSNWGSWIIVAISLHGLAIAGFRSGYEGLEADISTLTLYGTGVLLLRAATEFLLYGPEMRAAIGLSRAIKVSILRGLTEIPFAIVLVLLCNPQNPMNFATVIVMLSLGAATAFVAWHLMRLTLGEMGGSVQGGELYDAVFGAARRLSVPLRRLYILPENVGPRSSPSVGSKGDLMIPERLLRAASRREIDGVVAYELMLIKTRHVYTIWVAMIPVLVILIWRAYLYQSSPSETFALIREAGILISAFGAFWKSLGNVQSGAERAFLATGGDAEGWIAGVARIARIAGSRRSSGGFEMTARRCGIAHDRVPFLIDIGFPETGYYAIPHFRRDKLDLLS